MTLKIGDDAPDFTLPVNGGGMLQLSSLRGKKVVLYFYPKDMTSGCTRQAEDFRDATAQFDAAGAHILGMSRDSVKRHDKFVEKHALTFPLVSDEEATTLEAYGVWKQKSMYGRSYMGIERTTFVIDENGKISHIWRKVKVPGHVAQLLAEITN